MDSTTEPSTPSPFDELNAKLQASALKATRNAALLPADVGFHRSMDSDFSQDLDALSSRALKLTNRLLDLIATSDPKGKGKARLQDVEDLTDNFQSLIVEPLDLMLENTDTCLDEHLGHRKKPTTPLEAATLKKTVLVREQLDPSLKHASSLSKPQLNFKRSVDNSDTPWYPTLTHKYNAKVPLGYHFRDESDGHDNEEIVGNHPYTYEIRHLSYPTRMFQMSDPIPYKSFEETPFTWVSTSSQLESMMDKLRQAKEIAVDLEHHDYRTYAGFLCLMQISTREEDWVIDVLLLRDELSVLNEVFTNPEIVKVFHGAESDIVWLQQDFNLYIVNLFDTYHASKVLDFPRHGLAHLLEMYCDFIPDKKYQLADWRIRPLPTDMLSYARSDTHYLLFIYDNLRNALIDRSQSRANSPSSASSLERSSSLVKDVLSRSEDTSLRLYQNEPYDAESGLGNGGWDALARRWNKSALYSQHRNTQQEVFRNLHAWRDRVAREDDESPRYVLANQYLFLLAEQPPADMAGLMKMFRTSVPTAVRKRAKEVLDIIKKAAIQPTETTISPPAAVKVPSPIPDVFMEETVLSAATESRPLIWSNHSGKAGVAPKSSLFGSAKTIPAPLSVLPTAARSALLGSSRPPVISTPKDMRRLQDVVSKIHSSLVVVPQAPKADTPPFNAPEQPQENEDDSTGMQVEVPFVPASQRQPKELVEDTVISVGQARQKKRKRTKKEDPTTSKKTKQATDDAPASEPFDFSTAPSILDLPAEAQPSTPRAKKSRDKDKAKSKAAGFQGSFPAPMTVHHEKIGNKSHTFK